MEKLRFTIPEPCDANWNDMTPIEKGRHCSFCEKTVVDFSIMNTNEIIDWLQQPKNKKSTCGRFTKIQLEKGIDIAPKSLSLIPFLKKAAAVTLIGLSVTGLPLVVNGQTIIVEEIPAQYDTITKKVLIKPAEIRVIEEPAEYVTIEKKIMVEVGGFHVWNELPAVACDVQHIPISTIQTQLKNKGYYKGEIDNTLNEATEQAVIKFRRDNDMIAIFEVDKEVIDLLGIQLE